MKHHILFIDLSSTGVRAVAEAIAGGYHVSVILPRDNPLYRRDANTDEILTQVHELVWIGTASNAQTLCDEVVRIHGNRKVDAAVCLAEWTMENAAAACAYAGIAFTSLEAVRRCRNKYACRQHLQEAGLSNVRYRLAANADDVRRFADDVGYPVVLKPVSGMGSILVSIIRTPAEVAAAWGRVALTQLPQRPDFNEVQAAGVMVEEYVQGKLLSIEIGRNAGGIYPLAVNGRVRAQHDDSYELGFEVPPAIPAQRQQACVEYAAAVVQALGLDIGLFHVEIIDSESGPRLIETNPRLIGGDGAQILQDATGRSFYDLLFRIHRGESLGISSPLPVRRCVSTRKVEATAPIGPTQLEALRVLYRNAASSRRLDVTFFTGKPSLDHGDVVARFRAYGDDAREAGGLAGEVFDRTLAVLDHRAVA